MGSGGQLTGKLGLVVLGLVDDVDMCVFLLFVFLHFYDTFFFLFLFLFNLPFPSLPPLPHPSLPLSLPSLPFPLSLLPPSSLTLLYLHLPTLIPTTFRWKAGGTGQWGRRRKRKRGRHTHTPWHAHLPPSSPLLSSLSHPSLTIREGNWDRTVCAVLACGHGMLCLHDSALPLPSLPSPFLAHLHHLHCTGGGGGGVRMEEEEGGRKDGMAWRSFGMPASCLHATS